jgi:protein-L-isoaspartate(D-aspartate) O-methyltransferase
MGKIYCCLHCCLHCKIGTLSESGLAFAGAVARTPYQQGCIADARQPNPISLAREPDMNIADYTAMRRNMIDSQLRTNNVTDVALLRAIEQTPREYFVPVAYATMAYTDRPVTLEGSASARVLNPPLSAALLLGAAQIKASDHVLLIGSATGYSAILLGQLAKSVVAIDDDAALLSLAQANVARSQLLNIELVAAPMAEGYTMSAPYDVIVIDGAIEQLPDAIISQLVDGGRFVSGYKKGPVTQLVSGIKCNNTIALHAFIDNEIAPLSAFARKAEFVF